MWTIHEDFSQFHRKHVYNIFQFLFRLSIISVPMFWFYDYATVRYIIHNITVRKHVSRNYIVPVMCDHWVFRDLNGVECTSLSCTFDSTVWTSVMPVSCLCMMYYAEIINMSAVHSNTWRPGEKTEPDLGGGVGQRMCPWKWLLIICIWLMQIALFAVFPCRWKSSTFIVRIVEGQMAVRQWGEHHWTNKICQFLHSFLYKNVIRAS